MNRIRKLVTFDLGDLGAVAAGTPVDVSAADEIAVLVGGTFVATYSVEVSFDGSTFVAHPDFSGITAPKSAALGMRAQQIRLNVTAYTSGTVEGRASGAGPAPLI